jgi:hypothetical protein
MSTNVNVNMAFRNSNFEGNIVLMSPRKYPYFDVVVGLERSNDPESYAGGSLNYW